MLKRLNLPITYPTLYGKQQNRHSTQRQQSSLRRPDQQARIPNARGRGWTIHVRDKITFCQERDLGSPVQEQQRPIGTDRSDARRLSLL